MMRIACAAVLATFGFIALAPERAAAQVQCPEGKTATGECVNPRLAASMRLTGIIYSQPKISRTAYPVLPADDWFYRYPNSLITDPNRLTPAFTTAH